MRRETQEELIERVFEHLDAGTTSMAESIFRNPVSAYTSRERFEREKELLFRDRPLFIGLSCLLPRPGGCLTDDDSGTPILITRAADGKLRAFANICRHRGSRVVECAASGNRRFSCPYHGWTYDLEGRLVSIPGEEGFAGLDREAHGLTPLPLVERDGMIWVRPHPEGGASGDGERESGAQSTGGAEHEFDEQLGGLGPELASYGFERYHHFDTCVLHPRINWKIAVDTFLESYHLAVVHGDSLGPIFISNLCLSDGFGPNNRMVAIRRSFEELRKQPAGERNFLEHTIELYTLFPNTVLVHQADHVEVWRMFPDREHEDRATVRLSLYVPEAVTTEKAKSHWRANLDLAIKAVDEEDFRLGEAMQRGFYSGAQSHVNYGRNEPALIHFHRSLRRALGLSDQPS